MNIPQSSVRPNLARPPVWAFVIAFGILYTGYGLNFLAVRIGVETLPPFLFAGTHVLLAGTLLLLWQLYRRQSVALPWPGVGRAAASSLFLFVGGVGLVTSGESLGVESGVAAVIKASAPLWVALLETLRPGGEKATRRMFFGLLLGAIGVVVMTVPRIHTPGAHSHPLGICMLVSSALLFAIGTIIVRHWPPCDSVPTSIFYQMIIGGIYLLVLGTALDEWHEIHARDFTTLALYAFLFLLFVHSLGAFSAMNWLLRYLPASVVTTKFYVSPAVAVTAGWLALGESISARKIGSMILILAGVAVILTQKGMGAGKKPGH